MTIYKTFNLKELPQDIADKVINPESGNDSFRFVHMRDGLGENPIDDFPELYDWLLSQGITADEIILILVWW
jgi:hypothetical protein